MVVQQTHSRNRQSALPRGRAQRKLILVEEPIISTRRINAERVTVSSCKSLQDVLARLDAAVGHPAHQRILETFGRDKNKFGNGKGGSIGSWSVRLHGVRPVRSRR